MKTAPLNTPKKADAPATAPETFTQPQAPAKPAEAATPPADDLAAREARIAANEAAIAEREERLAKLLAEPIPAAAPEPKRTLMHVLDLSATPTSGKREHEIMVDGLMRVISFEPSKPTPLQPHIAIKFLKFPESFKLTDEAGELLPFQNTPKQPHELQAGERFKLDRESTIARYDELHTPALQIRVLQMDGGEVFRDSRDRQAMIAFIITKTEEKLKKSVGREDPLGIDEWMPPAENNDALDTGSWA